MNRDTGYGLTMNERDEYYTVSEVRHSIVSQTAEL